MDIDGLREILVLVDSTSDKGVLMFYSWLAYKVVFDVAMITLIALGFRGCWRVIRRDF